MRQYLDLLLDIIENGEYKEDRTGIGTLSVFGRQLRFNLKTGFPLLTTKKLHLKSIIYELLWFLKGDTNISYLKEHGVSIWNEWATESGELGPIYGKQWRSFGDGVECGVDQISNIISQLKIEPTSRRLVVTAWSPNELPKSGLSPKENVKHNKMALAPCHCLFQFYVQKNKLSCQLYQRSADAFLGVPFNIASYALLTHMIAQQSNLDVGEFVHTFGDCHLYKNHLTEDIVYKQLKRKPTKLPKLTIKRKPESIFHYEFNDFLIENYIAEPSIKAPIAV